MTLKGRGDIRAASTGWSLVLLVALCPSVTEAQTVRGRVFDQVMPQPAAGAIVSLERVPSPLSKPEPVRSILADEVGAYAFTATTAGNYRILVRRIGSPPFRSDVFAMALGETRRLDIHLQRVNGAASVTELGRITVLRATPCETSLQDAARITAFWEDARTALLATEISARDNLVSRRFVRFVRDLDPKSLDVDNETLYEFIAPQTVNIGFTSPSGDSLSTSGYWRRTTNTSFRYYGPDANALLSQAFVEDHCFSIIENGNRPGRIGLSFEPIERRKGRGTPAEIRGTVWLDSQTSELRSLEFAWTTLPMRVPDDHLGGEVLFSRLASGPWFVHRWRLRMPQEVLVADGRGTQQVRTKKFAILEEGGYVESATTAHGRLPAMVTGLVLDGDRRILAGARVKVAGTDRETFTDAAGRFRFDAVPPGLRRITVEHERYEALGVRAGDKQVLLDEGSTRELTFVGPEGDEVEALLCDGEPARGRGTIRLVFIDSATTRPMRGLRVSIAERDGNGDGFASETETDASGVVVFCNAPASRPLTLTARQGKTSASAELKLPRGGLMAQVVRWPGTGSIRL